MLSEVNLSEPSLNTEYRKTNFETPIYGNKRCELSEQSSERLRTSEVQDMLGDMLGDTNIDLADFENLDFADLIDDGYDDDIDQDSKEGTSRNLTSVHENYRNSADSEALSGLKQRLLSSDSAPISITAKRLSTSLSQITERWEEDEPLGDKATKAAVLHANVNHPDLKQRYPRWQDRVKAINRVWRELDPPKRQEFVDWARRNRANCPSYKRRTRRMITSDSLQSSNNLEMETNIKYSSEFSSFAPPQLVSSPTTSAHTPSTVTNTPTSSKATPDYIAFSTDQLSNVMTPAKDNEQMPGLLSTQKNIPSSFITDTQKFYPEDQSLLFVQQSNQTHTDVKSEKIFYEEKIEAMKKTRRSITAKCRHLQKTIQSTKTEEQPSSIQISAIEQFNRLQNEIENLKKSIQIYQEKLDSICRREKEISSKAALLSQQPISSNLYSSEQHQSFITSPLLPFKYETNVIKPSEQQKNEINTSNEISRIFRPKSTRGRKRKHPLPSRSTFLGKISFSSLQSDIDRDIFDTVDNLLNSVEMALGGNAHHEVQNEKPKQKRRRMHVQKNDSNNKQQPTDDVNAWEVTKQRILQKIARLHLDRHSLEQYNMHNKTLLHFSDQTPLPLTPPIIFSKDFRLGDYQLTFLSDFFDQMEKGDDTSFNLGQNNNASLEEFDGDIEDDQVDICLTFDPSIMDVDEMMSSLCRILQLPQGIEFKLETPPPTPSRDDENEGQNNTIASMNCSEESSSRNDGFIKQETFADEHLELSATGQPETTATGIIEQTIMPGNSQIDLLTPRENKINAFDLPSFLGLNGKDPKHDEFKWKGYGWMLYDDSIHRSFSNLKKIDDKQPILIHVKSLENMKALTDTRECLLCKKAGDGEPNLSGRLLNVDANEWVHVNCALWSAEVHESNNGALMNVENAICRANHTYCVVCKDPGASIRCFRLDCASKDVAYHLDCAVKAGGKFVADKTFFCANHDVKPEVCINQLNSFRRLYICRDENRLISKLFNHTLSVELMLRIGNLIFYKIGQLLPEQLKTFHSGEHIFPIGYKVDRIFWSTKHIFELEHYNCEIIDNNNAPQFVIKFGANQRKGQSASEAWQPIFNSINFLREENASRIIKAHTNLLNGENLFGLNETSITKMTESVFRMTVKAENLPGIEQLYTYSFKHGGTPLMDLPLAINPSGCVRCEPCLRTLIKRHTRPISSSPKKEMLSKPTKNVLFTEVVSRSSRTRSGSDSRFSPARNKLDEEMIRAYKASGISERMLQAPHHIRNEPLPTIAQYREMQRNWKSTVYLARSKIQGMGLYAKRDIDMKSMIIEYLGEMIRSEVGEMREKRYFAQNRGVYMFRIDDEWFVDATMCGGCARYINHSCDPNCSTKILSIGDEKKIIVVANRPIKAGEELTYDYQFEFEDDTDKIPCLCGAPNCLQWMN